MTREQPSQADLEKWHRWFAIECNNLAWRLSEKESPTAAELEEMLLAAHAAAFHWSKVGNELNVARARMLLAHVQALAGEPTLAMENARLAFDYVTTHGSPEWEIAFAHAVVANAAAAAREASLHRVHYERAKSLGGALADAEERKIFEATFRRVPAPA